MPRLTGAGSMKGKLGADKWDILLPIPFPFTFTSTFLVSISPNMLELVGDAVAGSRKFSLENIFMKNFKHCLKSVNCISFPASTCPCYKSMEKRHRPR